jgi:CO/xanthine dehydrogenase Mo-binding subunit
MYKYLGKSIPRFDAEDKVKGTALYPGDLNMPDQVYAKVLFAGHPHAIIKSIDTQKADSLPGVLAVFTAKDVPNNEYGLQMFDQPVLCGPSSQKPYADHVRFSGDNVAFVVAETEEIAQQALDLIHVVYEDLPGVFDPRQAMNSDAVKIHPDRDSNVFVHYQIRKGRIESAFKQADYIVECEYKTPAQEHAYLQPEAGLCYIDKDGIITIQVAGQWAHEDQEQIAHALSLPKEKIRVVYPAIGGAFGGREDMSVQILLALAVWRLDQRDIHRPVKIIWSREESIIGHHKRHPFFIKAKWGANKEGKVVAAKVELIADGGAYCYTTNKVLGNATLMCTGPYFIPNVEVDSFGVYTNNIVTGAFRGFGGPQGAFEAECQMDKLAEKIGIDPVEFRMRNLIKEGELLSVQTALPAGISIHEVTEKCALAAGWKKTKKGWLSPKPVAIKESEKIRHGIGFACAFKNVGFSFGGKDNSWATIELHGHHTIERAVLHDAGADVGQGAHSAFKQMAAEALDLPISKIDLIASDTAASHNSGSSSASRMTFMAGNAIRGAAAAVLAKWKAEERPAIATFQYFAPPTTPYDPKTGKSEPNFAYGYVAEVAEVEVDMETGQVDIKKVYCVDDVGQVVNPQQVEGQIEGAIVQACGYTTLENFIQKEGQVVTRHLSTYLIPTVLDIPDEVESIIHEHPDPRGPWGIRGMGEMPYLSMAPAIIAAVHQATGVWFDEFPLVPEKVWKGIKKNAK